MAVPARAPSRLRTAARPIPVFGPPPRALHKQYLDESTGDARSFTIATVVFAVLWMLSTGMGLSLILRRRTKERRVWVTCAIDGLTGWGAHHVETIVWVCVAAAIPIADLILQIQERPLRILG